MALAAFAIVVRELASVTPELNKNSEYRAGNPQLLPSPGSSPRLGWNGLVM
jgi:hypothetical protein